jgi:hypothetical protein
MLLGSRQAGVLLVWAFGLNVDCELRNTPLPLGFDFQARADTNWNWTIGSAFECYGWFRPLSQRSTS